MRWVIFLAKFKPYVSKKTTDAALLLFIRSPDLGMKLTLPAQEFTRVWAGSVEFMENSIFLQARCSMLKAEI